MLNNIVKLIEKLTGKKMVSESEIASKMAIKDFDKHKSKLKETEEFLKKHKH